MPDVIAAGDFAGDIITWYNQGLITPSFQKVILESNFPGVWPVNTFDPDNDLDLDILSASSTLNDIYWWENQLILSSPGGSQVQNSSGKKLNIYPNPFYVNAEIQFTLFEDSDISLRVLSSDGKLISVLFSGKLVKVNIRLHGME